MRVAPFSLETTGPEQKWMPKDTSQGGSPPELRCVSCHCHGSSSLMFGACGREWFIRKTSLSRGCTAINVISFCPENDVERTVPIDASGVRAWDSTYGQLNVDRRLTGLANDWLITPWGRIAEQVPVNNKYIPLAVVTFYWSSLPHFSAALLIQLVRPNISATSESLSSFLN